MKRPLVSIVIVTFNSGKYLARCLRSLPWKSEEEVIVIDNHSTDNSVVIAKQWPCKVFQLPNNTGYAAGNNYGVRHAKGEYILIMNPDVFLEKDSVKKLLAEYRKFERKFGRIILCPKVRLLNKCLNYFGMDIDFFGFSQPTHFGEKDRISQEFLQTTIVTGSCIFMKKAYFERIGGFDESYFLYHEDVEFSLRAHSKGYRVLVTNAATVTHAKNVEDFRLTRGKYYFLERNRVKTVAKHSKTPFRSLLGCFLLEPILIIHALLTGNLFQRLKVYIAWIAELPKVSGRMLRDYQFPCSVSMRQKWYVVPRGLMFLLSAAELYAKGIVMLLCRTVKKKE